MAGMNTGLLPSEAFSRRFRERKDERTRARMEFGPFALRIPEPDVGRLSMERMPFQREIYEETGNLPELIIDKGTQVGMTTMFVRWVLWVGAELNGRSLYVMPTQDIADAFSDDRVKRLMMQEALSELVPPGGTQNKRLKRIGRAGLIYFRGSMEETGLDNIPARALVLDEYDTLSQKNIPVVEARVGAQDDPLIRRLGVPRLQGTGIDQLYNASDMRRWLIKCDRCGEWQRVTWANMQWEELAPRVYNAWRACTACQESIEQLLRGGAGEWVAEHPERELRGYHIPRLIVPRTDLSKMVTASLSDEEETVKNHYNRDRAEPFETPEQRVSVAALESCRRPGIKLVESYVGFNPVTMGIDQSTTRGLHVRVSEHLNPEQKRVLWAGVVDAEIGSDPDAADQSALRRLAMLMQVFKVNMACIDHLPDGLFARAFCGAHRGRAYAVAFNTSHTAKDLIKLPPLDKPSESLVVVRRTDFITTTLDLLRHQRNLIPLEQPMPTDRDGKTWVEQMRNMVKVRKKDKQLREFYGYDEAGPIDWLMAELYDVVATEVLKLRLMEGALAAQMGSTTEVLPPNPTPDLNDWDAKPWSDDHYGVSRSGGTYGDGWDGDDDYRP